MQKQINEAKKDKEFLKIIKPIIETREFQKRIAYKHFNETSMYQHALLNSYIDYKDAKKFNLSDKEIIESTLAGLLHNFYPTSNMYKEYKPEDALNNSIKFYKPVINKTIAKAILAHKFPSIIAKIPTSKVALIVNNTDRVIKALDTSSVENINNHITNLENPYNFELLHKLFHNFLEENNININNKVLEPITSIKLRQAFYEYIYNQNYNIDESLLGSQIMRTVKREELLEEINFLLKQIQNPYTIDSLNKILKK